MHSLYVRTEISVSSQRGDDPIRDADCGVGIGVGVLNLAGGAGGARVARTAFGGTHALEAGWLGDHSAD